MTATVSCPKCGTNNTPSQKFCGECGTTLLSSVAPSAFDPEVDHQAIAQRVIICPICHKQVHPTATYKCPKCRADLTDIMRRTGVLPSNSYVMPLTMNAPEPTGESSFSFSGCIVSFLITFVIAVTLGAAGIFVLGIILTSMFHLSGTSIFYCTGIAYIMLFGVIWWAVYSQMQQGNRIISPNMAKSVQNADFETISSDPMREDSRREEHRDREILKSQGKNIQVYKRYSPSENQIPITEVQGPNDQPKFTIGVSSEEVALIYCPWCTQVYEIDTIGNNIMFNCINCKNNALVTRD